jgi:hypothetical protein
MRRVNVMLNERGGDALAKIVVNEGSSQAKP